MHFLVPLAGLLGIEIEALTDQLKRTIITNVVMVLFAAVGALFLLVAVYLAIAQSIGALNAALVLAAIALALALVMFISMRLHKARYRRLAVEKRRTNETSAFITTAAMTALPALPALLKSPLLRTIALPAAAIGAFWIVRRNRKPDAF